MKTSSAGRSSGVRFGDFELDMHSGELWKAGVRTNLQDQPLRVLVCLLEQPGRVVTRNDLRARPWAGDTFVDFEQGLNAAIRRLREALGDSADSPLTDVVAQRQARRLRLPGRRRILARLDD